MKHYLCCGDPKPGPHGPHCPAYHGFLARTASDRQEGGDHYKKHKLQPWDAIVAWDMGYLAGNVVKYVVRYKDKNGLEDLKKARHYLDKLIETESQ